MIREQITVLLGVDQEKFQKEFKAKVCALMEYSAALAALAEVKKQFDDCKYKYDYEQWEEYGYEKTSLLRETDLLGLEFWQVERSTKRLQDKIIQSVKNMLGIFIRDKKANQEAIIGISFNKNPRLSGEKMFKMISERWQNDFAVKDAEEGYMRFIETMADEVRKWNEEHPVSVPKLPGESETFSDDGDQNERETDLQISEDEDVQAEADEEYVPGKNGEA